jgi:hypothetical protein
MTVKRLRTLTLEIRMGGRIIHGNPDMLFSRYLALIPLLPASHVNIWGIHLFTQFWTALGEDRTRHIARLPRYLVIHQYAFDQTTMNTKDRQMSALRELRSLAVESFNSLHDDRQSMRNMLRNLASPDQASTHFFDLSVNASAAGCPGPSAQPDRSNSSPDSVAILRASPYSRSHSLLRACHSSSVSWWPRRQLSTGVPWFPWLRRPGPCLPFVPFETRPCYERAVPPQF